MSDVKVVINMAGMIEVSTKVNQKIARPMADRIVQEAGSGYRVESIDRPSVPGWARTRVFTDSFAAMRREVTRGALARALGGQ